MDEQMPNGSGEQSQLATGEFNVSESALAVVEDAEYELRIGDHHVANYQDVLNKAAAVSRDLAQIISDRKLSVKIGARQFVMVEGWTTCGAMLGVAIRPVSCEENAQEKGEFVAIVEAVRTSDGFVLGRGIASCGPDERDWKSRSRQARRSMAQTRAAGKAMRLLFSWIMEMAGYAATPFEEMEGSQVEERENPEADKSLPNEQPRGKRSKPAVSQQQLDHIKRNWIPKNKDPDGNPDRMKQNFCKWARETTKRTADFDPTKSAQWVLEDYHACCDALQIPTLEDLRRDANG